MSDKLLGFVVVLVEQRLWRKGTYLIKGSSHRWVSGWQGSRHQCNGAGVANVTSSEERSRRAISVLFPRGGMAVLQEMFPTGNSGRAQDLWVALSSFLLASYLNYLAYNYLPSWFQPLTLSFLLVFSFLNVSDQRLLIISKQADVVKEVRPGENIFF